MANNYIDSEGKIIKTSPMIDEHSIIKITEKTPNLTNIGKIVQGDENSNILQFEMNRYYDGIDLLNKDIAFIISNSLGVFMEKAVNLMYNEESIRFSWVLSNSVTNKSGTVTVAIEFFGSENGTPYALKTTPFSFNVEYSLDISDITFTPYYDWFTDFESRLRDMEENLGTEDLTKKVLDNLSYEVEDIDFKGYNDGNKETSSE